MKLWTLVEDTLQDARFGVRGWIKDPGFARAAVSSLALGIMATTAMYSVLHAVVLDPFPYRDVDTLMSVKVWEPGQRGWRTGYSTDQFLEIAQRNTVFEATLASTISDVLWTGDGEPQRLRGNHVTTNTFDVLGVPPLLGRAATLADGAPGAEPVVVLGHRFWQRQFGGDPSVLGRSLRLDGVKRTVVGVMPRRFMWRGADVYVPTVFERGRTVEGVRYVHLLGRLRPGVTEARAEADLAPIIGDLQRREPGQFPERWRVGLLSFRETFPSAIRETLWILFGAVGLLLLIACVNVSNLLLSRATARAREMAVRGALGAGRGRLARQLLTESVLLALAGGALGVPLAYGALQAIVALVPRGTIPDEAVISISTPVLLFTLGACFVTALVFGLAPALQLARPELAGSLKDSARGTAGGGWQGRLRSGLVAAQVALALMLLLGASLMVRTLSALQEVDLGTRPERLLTLRIPLPGSRYPDAERRAAFFERLLERVGGLPGVVAAGVNTGLHPFGNMRLAVEVPGSATRDERPVVVHHVDRGYVRALGIPVLLGRPFEEAEVRRREQVALVNQAFARRYFPGREALGARVRIPAAAQPPLGLADDSFEVVGVVRDSVNRGLTNPVEPELYVPYTIAALADRVVVLTRDDPQVAIAAVRGEVRALDAEQPLTDVRSLQSALDDFAFAGPRFSLVLFSVFASLGLVLAALGVYGVLSHAVSRRTREIGIRMALGARSGDVLRMVLASGLATVLLGIGLGLAGCAAAARMLAPLVWSVSPLDPASLAAASGFLLVVGLQTCVWPALRASRVDPASALRRE